MHTLSVLAITITSRPNLNDGMVNYAKTIAFSFEKDLNVSSELFILGSFKKPITWLRRLEKKLSSKKKYDIIHLHLSLSHIGGAFGANFNYLVKIINQIKLPLVVTIHDSCLTKNFVYFVKKQQKKEIRQNRINNSKSVQLFKTISANIKALIFFKVLQKKAFCFIVHSKFELSLVDSAISPKKISIIPHFIKPIRRFVRGGVKKKLGLHNKTVLTVLGFISERKNQLLAVESMKLLPSNFVLVLAGAPLKVSDEYYKKILLVIRKKGLKSKVKLTGHLSLRKYAEYISATDIAICPFKSFSASGSLSDMLSANVPILSSSLPQIDELNESSNFAIKTFLKGDPKVLAKRINEVAAQNHSAQKKAIKQICSLHSIKKVSDLYYSIYQDSLKKKY